MADDASKIQRFARTHDGALHEVTVTSGAIRQTIVWTIDDVEIERGRTADERITLQHDEHGAIKVHLSKLGKARRAQLFTGDDAAGEALLGINGIELDPEAGSWAARRLERAAANPTRHTIVSASIAVLGVVAPIVAVAALIWVWQHIPKPDVDAPDIPTPHLPSIDIPWPDIPWPNIPWPSIDAPDWLGYAKYVIPVLIAIAIARGEIRKERERRAEREQRQHDGRDDDPRD